MFNADFLRTLESGGNSIDAVVDAVCSLEDNPYFDAGGFVTSLSILFHATTVTASSTAVNGLILRRHRCLAEMVVDVATGCKHEDYRGRLDFFRNFIQYSWTQFDQIHDSLNEWFYKKPAIHLIT